ncbi:DNA-processing protein DprA [Fictibacillus enclensis]|uniref:DNA processing protein DprA n=1 Tax=Fictibacillus enclensis TaxID=1017270 RepID=A0A0V8JD28_9BACL|nr:DNA-processing protein DprA [Fictibacillus enclensis]KSU85058.1 DNA processing protein DprA [Fictibacillus enclensis]MDM5338058.1 DNA-processing protein DprA [Fictibacillus enclensis]SCB90266.1 DNA processing protein [Fictibacillus enclensis]
MDRERLILLHHCRGAGWKTIQSILAVDPDLKSIFQLTKAELREQLRMNQRNSNDFWEDIRNLSYRSIKQTYEKHNIKILTYFDSHYPGALRYIFDPPWVLYSKGNMEALSMPLSISIVGTRHPTGGGLKSLEKILNPLLQKGWMTVSGLAAGIDTHAHELTLTHSGSTIAVLGSGIGQVYPKSNMALARRITKSGLLLSEYPYETPPRRWQFPERNRIISGLTRGTLVVEARERSGSLITADQAMEQGREVFAVPGSILDECAAGTNRLIQQGAKLVMEAEDILHELSLVY